MSNAHKIVNQNISKRNNNNKEMYDEKVYVRNLIVGDRVLMKDISKRRGTGNLQSFSDNEIYKVIPVHKDLAICQAEPEMGGSKIKTKHWNLLFLCGQLLSKSLPVRKFFTSDHNHHQHS